MGGTGRDGKKDLARSAVNSLAVKVGVAIVLAEILVLSLIGSYYLRDLSAEIDAAAERQLRSVSVLLQESQLKYSAVGDSDVMGALMGEELEQGMVVSITGNIFHALDTDMIGRSVVDVPGMDPEWFSPTRTESQIIPVDEAGGSFLIGVTPIFTLDSARPFLFAFLKVDTSGMAQKKADARNQFILAAIFCVVLTSVIIVLSFNRLILRRIRQSATFTDKVRRGDLTARLETDGADELSVLEEGLNDMVADLEQRGQQRELAENLLREANETLENRVGQRTGELQETVERLQSEVEEHRVTSRALRRQSSIVRLLQRITVAANECATVEEALQVCLDAVCNHFGWPVGHVFRVSDDESGDLVSANLWHLEDPVHFRPFKDETLKSRVTLGQGLPGRVLRSGSPVWVTGSSRRTMKRAAVADECGLMAGFAFPIMVGREVVAVLEFFTTSSRRPESDLFEVMRDVGVQLGRVVERRRAQQNLEQAMHDADQANRAKSAFLSSLSHELRTPMNAIMGFSELLRSNGADPLSDRQADQVDTVLQAARHMVHLIDQVLDLAKIEAGQYTLEPENAGIRDLVTEGYEMILPLARQRGVSLDCHWDSIPERDVFVDRTALVQAVLNLLSNAVSYGGSDRPVEIYCENQPLNRVRIVVKDYGPGIPKRDRNRILQPFTRLDSTRGKAQGTGIGLNITKRLVEMMGGALDFDSIVGEGSTFYIELPMTLGAPSAKAAQQPRRLDA